MCLIPHKQFGELVRWKLQSHTCCDAEVPELCADDIKLLYVFFWVICRRLNFICRRFRTLCLFHLHRQVGVYTYLPMKMEQSVPKCRHTKFRCREITQKKIYNIQNTAKVWNQGYETVLCHTWTWTHAGHTGVCGLIQCITRIRSIGCWSVCTGPITL